MGEPDLFPKGKGAISKMTIPGVFCPPGTVFSIRTEPPAQLPGGNARSSPAQRRMKPQSGSWCECPRVLRRKATPYGHCGNYITFDAVLGLPKGVKKGWARFGERWEERITPPGYSVRSRYLRWPPVFPVTLETRAGAPAWKEMDGDSGLVLHSSGGYSRTVPLGDGCRPAGHALPGFFHRRAAGRYLPPAGPGGF